LAHPGGNATGFITFEYGLAAKWLELLKEIAQIQPEQRSFISTGLQLGTSTAYANYATNDGFCVGAGGKLIKVGLSTLR
jgi:hypothetical protein